MISRLPTMPGPLLVFAGLLAFAATGGAQGSMASQPMQLRLLASPPNPFPRDGALVVRMVVASRNGNQDPRAITIVGPGNAAVALEVVEIAPGLHRLAPPSGSTLPEGTLEVRGVGVDPIALEVRAAGAAPLPAPVVRSARRTRRTIREPLSLRGGGPVPVERVTLTLGALPDRAVALAVRWPGWTDSEGGLYGAWTRFAERSRTFPLICSAEDDCGEVSGHIPRAREAGEAQFVDDAGHLSAPSRRFRVN